MLKTAVCVLLIVVLAYYTMWKSGESPPPQRYRNGSFAPVRNSSRAKWFVDGEDYMSAAADAIESAKYEILITDWQMNPYIFMKRPETGVNSSKWRLDQMLSRKWLNVAAYPKTLFRWSHHEKMVIVDRKIAFAGGIDLCYGRWDTHSHELMDDYPTHPCAVKEEGECVHGSQDTRYSRWIGKDYRNTFFNNESETNWEKPFDDYEGFNRSHIPRMPWHDVACAFTGAAVSDAVEHFTQRYNALNPRFSFENIFYFSWWKNWGFLHLLQPYEQGKNDHILLDASAYDVRVQILRSVDGWSAEQPQETSIYNAYLHAIENAEHFIYIENQFFISSQDGFLRKVKNKIQSALVDRIVRAHEAGEKFHVMIVLPLKPEFAGEWDSDSASAYALRDISSWNYVTICNGEDSLCKKLEKKNVSESEIQNYFSVFGLRTHGLLKGNFVTEIIYVHSKVMIVDDRLAIIGSANINDRSMLGERDSEVAVIVEDAGMIDGKMNGKPYQVGKFSHSLRCHLVKEHMGLLGDEDKDSEINVEDPLESSFLVEINDRASRNNIGYEEAFGPGLLPMSSIETFDELEKQGQTPTPLEDTNESRKMLAKIQGNIVTYPCSFLKKDLKPPMLDYFHAVPMFLEEPHHGYTSCTAIKTENVAISSGFNDISPQGIGFSSFKVYCDMTSKNGVGVTVIGHDSEARMNVDGCANARCYSRKIKYDLPMELITAIIKTSKKCEQFMKYQCFHSATTPEAWWVSRQGTQMKYLGGAAVNSKKCACGMTNSCAGGGPCNCDMNDAVLREDSSFLTNRNTLPVTELRFGDTGTIFGYNEHGYHTLGKLLCWG